MKKTTILALFVAFLFAGTAANAQEQGDVRIGAGLAIGTEAGRDDAGEAELGLGINFGLEYLITDVISIAPSYTSFFKNEVGGADYNLSALNVDVRYYFGGDTQLYGLAGFSSVKAKVDGGLLSVSDTESGLNIGAGVNLPFGDSLMGNLQAKYQTPGDGQIVVNAGLVFGI